MDCRIDHKRAGLTALRMGQPVGTRSSAAHGTDAGVESPLSAARHDSDPRPDTFACTSRPAVLRVARALTCRARLFFSPVSCAQHGLIDGIATAAAGPVKRKTGSSQHLHCVADAGPSRFPL